ncbi:MAG: glycogen synthase GlgA [Candidatus Omnitrophica bacterium]|nr:glycogen synthase GlgA [Candidatus Omnitrophota bacterium]MDD5488571.1 glycogen synthase GlgA [Candidatus Omnitrophota bacterium]
MSNKLSVAFLWHMHQPLYKDMVSGRYCLPWVRLHSTYSYLDMASMSEKYPQAKCTFNFTPSLIWQLLDISSSDKIEDTYLDLSLKDAQTLDDEDKVFILKNFFSCDFEKAIAPIKKYKDLFARRGENLRKETLLSKSRDFSDQDMRDLQVFFNLAWCGFTLRNNSVLVKKLLRKGGDYTEDEKKRLLRLQKKVVSSILPTYKRLQDAGIIEISTTPFYHPIMPLICNDGNGQGYDFTEDARVHVARSVALYEKVFGRKPAGMWPSEGSVSQKVIPLFAEAGVKWLATDEGIVLESFRGKDVPRQDLIYGAFTAEEAGQSVDMVFRDINLSNAISFRYSGMPPKKAALDLLNDIKNIGKAVSKADGQHIVSIILDGENPWPYYPDGGRRFLSEVYKQLIASREAELVTIGGFLEANKERKKIEKLYSGSWIDRNFNKWIGSPQKNKAWEFLAKARKDLLSSGHPSKEALEELYIAEGSDWFWWYDDFGTELNFIFDDLFRMHLSNMYVLNGKEAPYYLSQPIHAGPKAKKVTGSAGGGEMASAMKVLFVSSEMFPFAKTGGLADVVGSLPKTMAAMGHDVRVIMPFYKDVAEGNFDITMESTYVNHPLFTGIPDFDVYSCRQSGVTTYLVDCKKFFWREGLYGTPRGDHSDNAIRFAFFSAAALAATKAVGFKPDVIHCNDWQSALVPFYLRTKLSIDNFYSGIKTLFTIHNMAYQGIFSRKVMSKIDVPEEFFNMEGLEFYGMVNYMKAGIIFSDLISTVSHKYASEIMTPEFGAGLDGLLRVKKDSLYGILNGADYSIWSPKNDKFIKTNFDSGSLGGKMECKKDLIAYTGLELPVDRPILGSVSRLASQKGMDLVAGIMDKIVDMGFGVVILGTGSEKTNRDFTELAKKYAGIVHVCNDFNEELAHKIEAGCDMFLMPSRYEPCGLNHMYSIKYGTIPIVRATGGLDDVIVDFDEEEERSNGIKFGPADEKSLLKAIKRAHQLYRDKDAWHGLVMRAMSCDFSWENSAKQYIELYRHMLNP